MALTLNKKLNILREQAESATAAGDEYASLIKQLEAEDIQKSHEINSLQSKIKSLEDQLEKTENKLQVISLKSQEADIKAESLEKTVSELENQLENAESRYDELQALNKATMEEMAEYERQLEIA